MDTDTAIQTIQDAIFILHHGAVGWSDINRFDCDPGWDRFPPWLRSSPQESLLSGTLERDKQTLWGGIRTRSWYRSPILFSAVATRGWSSPYVFFQMARDFSKYSSAFSFLPCGVVEHGNQATMETRVTKRTGTNYKPNTNLFLSSITARGGGAV